MPLTLSLTLDDETLAALRGSGTVVVTNPTPGTGTTPGPSPVVTPTTPWETVVSPIGLTFPCWWDNVQFFDQSGLDSYVLRVNARNKNLWLAEQTAITKTYSGPYPAASLTDADKAYLYAVSMQAGMKDVFYNVLSGSHGDVSRAINMGFTLNNGAVTDPIASYTGPLKPFVAAYRASLGL